MEKVRQNKIATLLASAGLLAGMVVATQAMSAGHMGARHYAVDSAGSMVVNGSGECWVTSGGVPGPQEACGDEMPVEEVQVVATGPVDSDGDGVPDDRDKCPGTRAGAKVDADGCEIIENLTIDLVEGEFAFDSAELKPGTKAALDDVANQIKESRGNEQVTIVGHTDSTGPEDYNMELSVRRAQSAADYLESQGITDIAVKGMGETQPIADNASKAGRAENRRIELTTR